MRNLLLPMMLVFFGCNKDEVTNAPDLSVKIHDLSATGDQGLTTFCDPVKQDCPAGQKCTYLTDPADAMSLVAACVPITGTAGFEMPCERDAAQDPGMDNCAAGFFCSVIGWGGATTSQHHCNQLCATAADCPADHNCLPRTDSAGDCVRNCGMLGSTTCGGGLVCADPEQDISSTMMAPIVFLTCRANGGGGIADACMDDTDCADLLLCDTNEGTCSVPLCDGSHGCPDNDAGISCTPFTDTVSFGVCQ